VGKRKRKKRLIRLQVHPYRDSLTGLITPVKYLQTFSIEKIRPKEKAGKSGGATSSGSAPSASPQRDDLCGQLHVVYPGRYNYSCSSVPVGLYLWREGLYSKAKEETWIRSRLLCRLTRYG
jgi:hypothetical protein